MNKRIEETPEGLLNYKHDMGSCYVTHISFNDMSSIKEFEINELEIGIALAKRVMWILFIYHDFDGQVAYRFNMNNINLSKKGHDSFLFKINSLQKWVDGKWV